MTDWPSLLSELARSVALGARPSLLDLARLTGAATERTAQRNLVQLREVAGPLGILVLVEDGVVRLGGEGAGVYLYNSTRLEDSPEPEITEKSRRRRRIRGLGLCVDCKGLAEAQGFCSRHLAAHRRRSRERKRRLRASGRCRDCGKRSKKSVCRACAEGYALQSRIAYRAKRSAGRCICGATARPGKATCARCAERQGRAEEARKARRRALGLCVKCERPTDGETERCAEHREAHRVASGLSYHRRRRSS